MQTPAVLGIIAGSGLYPRLLADSARRAGVSKIVAIAFTGETDPALAQQVDDIHWLRVGQLGRLLECLSAAEVQHAIMAGQIAPHNLFNLRPDLKALLLLARLPQRNAETLFGAIADELAAVGVELLPAVTFLEEHLAPEGLIAGRKLNRREEADIEFGLGLARQVSALDIGQTVVVRHGTVIAVEAFEGTNEAIKRGGLLARKGAIVVKVSKPLQDMRFDVPVIGPETLRVAAAANVRVIALEAGRTLLLEKEQLVADARQANISIVGR
ncbi:MAG: UDP-2,3-diacylglucosamine diphosphatase LpxI [Chthoniobacterales bacterium]